MIFAVFVKYNLLTMGDEIHLPVFHGRFGWHWFKKNCSKLSSSKCFQRFQTCFSTSMFFQRQCLSTSFIYDIHHDVLGIVSKHQAARFRTVSRLWTDEIARCRRRWHPGSRGAIAMGCHGIFLKGLPSLKIQHKVFMMINRDLINKQYMICFLWELHSGNST